MLSCGNYRLYEIYQEAVTFGIIRILPLSTRTCCQHRGMSEQGKGTICFTSVSANLHSPVAKRPFCTKACFVATMKFFCGFFICGLS